MKLGEVRMSLRETIIVFSDRGLKLKLHSKLDVAEYEISLDSE